MRNKKKYITLTAILFLSLTAYSKNKDTDIITINKWYVLHNQDSSIENIKKSKKWKTIAIPGFIKHGYVPKRNFQYVWLKGEFEITGDPSNFFGVSPGIMYYTDIVYINDKIVGQTTWDDKLSIHHPRSYRINPGILKRGKNDIYIYLGIYGKQSGGMLNEVLILNQEHFYQTKESRLFLYHDFPMGLAVLFFLVFILLVILYFFNRNEISIIFSMIFFLMYTISFSLDFSDNNPLSQDLRLTLLYYISILNPLNWFLILQAFFKRYLPDLNKALFIYFIIITFLIFTNIDTTSELYLANFINRVTIIIAIFISPYVLFKVYSQNKDRTKMFLFIFYFSFIFLFYLTFFFISLDGKYRYTIQDMFYIPFLLIHLITLIIRDIIKKETEIKNKYKTIQITSSDS